MTPRLIAVLMVMAVGLLLPSCGHDDFDIQDQYDESVTRIHTDNTYFKDAKGRYVFFHGVNVSGSTKVPSTTDPISYVNKPFSLEDADENFARLKWLGFNGIRLLVIWEGVEPYGKGIYDDGYLDFIEQIVSRAKDWGIYVLLDMHQDMFSRHLFELYDDELDQMSLADQREIELGQNYGYNNRISGDGAPFWAVQLAMPEKEVNGPEWGLPMDDATAKNKTTDFRALTTWFVNVAISVDVNRCFAAFFAGDKVTPNYFVDGQSIKDYLQEAYTNSWVQIARRVAPYPNVMGYDIINEPGGVFVAMTVWAMLYREAKASPGGNLDDETIGRVVNLYLETLVDQGLRRTEADRLFETLMEFGNLPRSIEQIHASGLVPPKEGSPWAPDLDEVLKLNYNFNRNYLQPLHERVGAAILAEDPDAILFIEEVLGLPDRGLAGYYAEPMRRPGNFEQIAFTPHYYTDIYPKIGYNSPPREFTVEEKEFRDYYDDMKEKYEAAMFSLGNPPVVLGEFGTYFNFNGIEQSMAEDYIVSSTILDPYYEATDQLLFSRMQWCYSPENTAENGDNWNKEDFSILGPDQKPRGQTAYSRPYPRFASGRPLEMHFYSDHHYYDPVPDRPDPVHEFYLRMGTRETPEPTEIFIPPVQYPDGIYVYVSDGRCVYDEANMVLYWYPEVDDPGVEHEIRLRPPYEDFGDNNWDYFFNGKISRSRGDRS